MSDVATRKDIDEIVGILHAFMQQVSDKFDSVDQKFDSIDQKFEQLESKMDQGFADLHQKYSHLLDTIDAFIGRIDRYEVEIAARDNQFERLLVWARKVSAKTGIPLEDL